MYHNLHLRYALDNLRGQGLIGVADAHCDVVSCALGTNSPESQNTG